MIRAALMLLCLALPANAAPEEDSVLAGLSQNRIAITAAFDGTELLIFGTVKRSAPMRGETPPGIIVTVSGPSQEITVRRKERWAGIWVNRAALKINRAPSFYAIATSGPLTEVLSFTDDLRYSVSIPQAIRTVGAAHTVEYTDLFTDALVRIRSRADLYQNNESTVNILEDTLFDTSITLPANLVEGDYVVRLLLTRDREVISTFETEIYVQKVGLERFVYNLAHEQPLLYGLLSLVLAIGAGWAASQAFRFVRG
ncbi:TIGR02186 family protein [Oceaniglobus indicus]|uniref:TIGR02186 family protein n=1 Tax=Oceaniglobus indicus TaxID=2047749 RepID=UPI000C19C292|nr:TIGR02186 family protein [Oceaniglobus indicus]